MTAPRRKRPGRLWLLFFGKKRRGFPELLVYTVGAVVLLALAFGLPGGARLSRYATAVSVAILVLLILGSLGLVVLAWLRPRGRR
ncbi:MAG TPA: hypothetical protein VF134_06085 [Candidatus Dormibacteraeota bacterium]